jgi:hypothetical protein
MSSENQKLYYSNAFGHKSITVPDYGRIIYHIHDCLKSSNVPPDILHQLYMITSESKKYFSNEVPATIVTMNSEIILADDQKNEFRVRIVYPEDKKEPGDISICSSLGTACLGASESSYIYYYDETGYKRALIKKILFQPEKEKLYNL